MYRTYRTSPAVHKNTHIHTSIYERERYIYIYSVCTYVCVHTWCYNMRSLCLCLFGQALTSTQQRHGCERRGCLISEGKPSALHSHNGRYVQHHTNADAQGACGDPGMPVSGVASCATARSHSRYTPCVVVCYDTQSMEAYCPELLKTV